MLMSVVRIRMISARLPGVSDPVFRDAEVDCAVERGELDQALQRQGNLAPTRC
jgi:hypothetical protein